MHVYLNGELGPALWSISGVPSTGWEVAEVTVSSPATFRVNSHTQYLILGTSFKWAIITIFLFGILALPEQKIAINAKPPKKCL